MAATYTIRSFRVVSYIYLKKKEKKFQKFYLAKQRCNNFVTQLASRAGKMEKLLAGIEK